MKKLLFVMLSVAASVASAKTIAFWPFGDKGLTDASGNGNTLEADANVTVGDTASMNGAQTLFSTVNALNLSSNSAVTVEFWTKFKASDNAGAVFFLEFTELTGNNAGGFYVDYGEVGVAVLGMAKLQGGADSGAEENPANGIGDDQWHHVAFVMDETVKSEACTTLYVDKTKVYTHCYQYRANSWGTFNFPSGKKLYVGSRNNSSLKFKGEIDNLRISNKALKPEDFINLDGTAPMPKPLAYWPFGAAGATDLSGNGNDILVAPSGVSFANGAMSFDGTQSDTLTRLPIDLSNCPKGLTTEFWMRTTAEKASAQILLELTPNVNSCFTGVSGFFCDINDGSKMCFNTKTEGTIRYHIDKDTKTEVQDGAWHHVAYVIEPSEKGIDLCRFYLDGVQQEQDMGGNMRGTNIVRLAKDHLYLGARSGGEFAYKGEIDDIRMTPAALSPEQFMTARSEEDATVLGHWTFSRNAETVNSRGAATLSATGVTYENGVAVIDGAAALSTSALSIEGPATVECFFSTDGAWHHLVKVHGDGIGAEPTTVKVDGEDAASPLLTFASGVLQVVGSGFAGKVDDVRVTAGALPASDWLAAHTDDTPVELCRWTLDSQYIGFWNSAIDNPLYDVANAGVDYGFYDRAVRIAHGAGLRTRHPLRLSHWPSLTVEWFARTSQTTAGNFLELGSNYNNLKGSFVASTSMLSDGRPGAGFRAADGFNIRTTPKDVSTSDGEWHHYAYVLDRSSGSVQTRLYIDGVAQNVWGAYDKTGDVPFANEFLMVGARLATSSDYFGYASFKGDIDELRIVNAALNPSEMMTLADRAKQASSVVAHWRFDGETPLADLSGNGNDLTGTATFEDGAAVFDGTTSLQTAKSLSISPYRQVTVEAVFMTDAPEETGVLFETGSNYSDNGGSISCYYNGAGNFYGRVDACTRHLAWTSDSSFLRDTRWHHVAVQMDMDAPDKHRIRYWIDGILAGAWTLVYDASKLAADTTFADVPLYLGAREGKAFFVKGKMKEVRVSAGILPPSEFLGRPSPESDPDKVVAYWSFSPERHDGDWQTDDTGHGYVLETTGKGVSLSPFSDCLAFEPNHDSVLTSTRIDFARMEKFTIEAYVRPRVSQSMCLIGSCTWNEGTVSHVPGIMFATGTNATGAVDLQGTLTVDGFRTFQSKSIFTGVTAGADTYNAKDRWRHIALVVDRTSGTNGVVRYYCDRRQVYEHAMRAKPDFVPLRLAIGGHVGDLASVRFVGDIDDVRISADALAPEGFLAHRSSGKGFKVIVR